MSLPEYSELLQLLAEIQRIQQLQTLQITLNELMHTPTETRRRHVSVDNGARHPSAAQAAAVEPLFDAIRTQSNLYEEIHRIRDLLLDQLNTLGADARAAHSATPRAEAPPKPVNRWTNEDIVDILNRAQMALLKHPTAAQAAFCALVKEGREFAATPEGIDWLYVLGNSELVARARWVWETTSLNMLEEDSTAIVPSTYLEAVLRASGQPDMESLLSYVRGMGHG
jgi:hypothetical protein